MVYMKKNKSVEKAKEESKVEKNKVEKEAEEKVEKKAEEKPKVTEKVVTTMQEAEDLQKEGYTVREVLSAIDGVRPKTYVLVK